MQERHFNRLRDAYWTLLPQPLRRPVYLLWLGWWRLRQHRLYFEYAERRKFMRRAFTTLSFNGIAGDYAEFGCHGGVTFGLAHQQSRKNRYPCTLWAFDSFCGLPPTSLAEDEHPLWVQGAMKTSLKRFRTICKTHGIPPSDYRIVPGYYEETLTGRSAVQELPGSISFAYVDCDLYSSTRTVLEFLATRIKHGSIVAFDDYYCYSEAALAGERLACAEFLQANPDFHFSPYCQFGWHGMSFIAEKRAYWKSLDCSAFP